MSDFLGGKCVDAAIMLLVSLHRNFGILKSFTDW